MNKFAPIEDIRRKTPTLNRTDQRTIIKHSVFVGMTPRDTYKFMQMNNKITVCRTVVLDWHKRLQGGTDSPDLGDRQIS